MKNSYKVALLAALGLASVSAQAAYVSGDLVVGIYDATVSKTVVADLGLFSSLSYGETWTAAQLGLGTAGFGATLNANTVFGVYGGTTVGVPHNEYLTTSGSTPNMVSGTTEFNVFKSPMATLATGGQTYDSSLTVGNGGLTDALGYDSSTPVTGTASFWTVASDSSAPTVNGFFTLDANSETLTYMVPEPTTVSLFAGAGLLLAALRRKQA